MGAFRQLGDPVCPDCLCQHHGDAYEEYTTYDFDESILTTYNTLDDGATIESVGITTTETCCIVVNAATTCKYPVNAGDFEIERPKGTIRTQQRDTTQSNNIVLTHHASWEVLQPGTYTYFLVNRAGVARNIIAAWMKIIASDCEG